MAANREAATAAAAAAAVKWGHMPEPLVDLSACGRLHHCSAVGDISLQCRHHSCGYESISLSNCGTCGTLLQQCFLLAVACQWFICKPTQIEAPG
eukprot:78934-Pelagomonas_calceolata.AAC.1